LGGTKNERPPAPVIDKLSRPARTLSRSGQLALVGGAALLAAAAAVFVPYTIIQPYMTPRVLPPQPIRHGTIRLTPEQGVNIKTGPVRELTFRTEHRTDGKIAIDDDQTTPVFSPYSRRVTRLLAKPGDVVEQGAPLFAIDDAERGQGNPPTKRYDNAYLFGEISVPPAASERPSRCPTPTPT
jgi:multidrug efflux pump subunit AcrA (membrane-fusion protein)